VIDCVILSEGIHTRPAANLRLTNVDLCPLLEGDQMTRDNLIYLVIGALVVAVAALGYQLYEAKKEPTGLHINVGEKGISIEGK